MALAEVKDDLSRYLRLAEEEEILITRHGRAAGVLIGFGSEGDRAGQHSIRINEQYRVCFRWENGHADEVEIADYH